MDTFKRTFLITLFLSLGLSAAFLAGFFVRDALGTPNLLGGRRDGFTLLQEAYGLLKDHALDPLPAPPALEYGMIRGMVQAYGDPHTIFLEPVQTELESNSLAGKFGGIGVRMGRDAAGFPVLYPYPDSPAIKAGVKEGDRLIAVDDKPVTPDTPDDLIQAAIRGPVGQPVAILLSRAPDYNPQKISIRRAEISLPSVTWHVDASEPRLGVIEINIIAASTPQEIQKAVQDMQSRGATYFALDLRNNGGGLLDAGVDAARLFLRDGEVIQQQYRGQEVKAFPVERPGPLADIPLVVLVNGNTASAAEIIAGALQAHKRALLIGSITYGKDTIQLVFNLEDGSSLHITSAHWWIPGVDLPRSGKGLQPDIPLATDNTDPRALIETAIQALLKQ